MCLIICRGIILINSLKMYSESYGLFIKTIILLQMWPYLRRFQSDRGKDVILEFHHTQFPLKLTTIRKTLVNRFVSFYQRITYSTCCNTHISRRNGFQVFTFFGKAQMYSNFKNKPRANECSLSKLLDYAKIIDALELMNYDSILSVKNYFEVRINI